MFRKVIITAAAIIALGVAAVPTDASAYWRGGGWHGGYGGWHGGGWATTGAGLPPAQSSVGCSLRLTIMDRRPVTITDLRREMRWPTACNGSNPMIPVAARI